MKLNIELTSNCQATCISCSRYNTVDEIPKNQLIDLDTMRNLINEVGQELTRISFDGSFADSPIHPNFLEIIKYITDTCPWIYIKIATNGSYKPKEFWHELGTILSVQPHDIKFALDGIDNETQNMYRRGTNYNRIIRNATAFIEGGGHAIWKMIPFSFNKDLEEEGNRIAKSLGFIGFERNRLNRYRQKALRSAVIQKLNFSPEKINDKEADMMDKTKEKDVNDDILIKVDTMLDKVDDSKNLRENLNMLLDNKKVLCVWAAADEYMISHDGTVWRCCWHDANYHYKKINEERDKDRDNYLMMTKKYNRRDVGWNNINTNKFSDIIKHKWFTEDLPDSMCNSHDDPVRPKLLQCSEKCSIL